MAADASTECPGTTAELTAGTCQPQYFYRRCTTPDAVCFCAPRAFCGGALAPPQDSGTWACKANDPDTGKPDPCFGALPKHGQACEDEGRVCTGGAPCVEVQSKATCRDGKWFVVRGRVGPPPE